MGKSRKGLGHGHADEGQTAAAHGDAAVGSLWSDPFVQVLLILAAGFAVYFTTITTPFIFDDYYCLIGNPAIREFSFFTDPQRVLELGVVNDIKNNILLRPVAYFTFALNFALHGFDVRGYHLVNLLLHLGNALLVYLLMWLTLRTPAMDFQGEDAENRLSEQYGYLPLFCALLFVCHPLQTQAVTYIIQRFVPMVTFFCLSALVLYINGRLATKRSVRTTCYLIALASCVLAMKSKENAFTFPVIIGLYEFIFFRGATGDRIARLIPFLLTMSIIPLKLNELSSLYKPVEAESIVDAVNLVNFRGTSSFDYLMSQFGVIATYLRLLLLPINQNLDYDYPLQKVFFSPAVVLPLLLLLAIAAAGVWLLVRSRDRRTPESGLFKISAFGTFWFFIALAVESSIVPIDDLIFEHRAYLPSIGFFMATLAGGISMYAQRTGKSAFRSRLIVGFLVLAVISYATAGFLRNRVWADAVTLWRDVVSKSPNKARGHNSLGNAFVEHLKFRALDPFGHGIKLNREDEATIEEAIKEYRTAISIKPKYVLAHLNLGIVFMMQKKYEEAVGALSTAVGLAPENPVPLAYLGKVYEERGDLTTARRKYHEAIAVAPAAPDGHMFLGALNAREGNDAEALQEFEIAFRLFPNDSTRERIAELKKKLGA